MSKITGKVNYKEVLKGDTGYTFEPHVTVDGILYWSNNGNLENPLPVNLHGKQGFMFIPHVDSEGNLSWTNTGELENPPTVNIKGDKGYFYTPHISEDGILTWSNNGNLENPQPFNISDLILNEVKESRIDTTGKTFSKLKERLDSDFKKLSETIKNNDTKDEVVQARTATTGENFMTLDDRIDHEVMRLREKIEVTMLEQEDKESHTIDNSIEGLTTNMIIKGKTMYKKKDGTYTDTWGECVTLESFGETEGNKISILSSGKNLFDGELEIGSILSTGENDNNTLTRIRTKNYIDTKNLSQIFISSSVSGTLGIRFYDYSKKCLGTTTIIVGNTSSRLDLRENTRYVRFSHVDNTDLNSKYMISEKSINIDKFEPYKCDKKDILIKDLGFDEGLRGLNDTVYDELNSITNKAIKRIERRSFTGDEDWQLQSINEHGIANFSLRLDNIKSGLGISNKFKQQNTTIANTSDDGFFIGDNFGIYIRVKENIANNVDMFKQLLREWNMANNPLEICYELSNSIETPLDENISPKTFGEKTYVSFENAINGTSSFKVPVNTNKLINDLKFEKEDLKEKFNNLTNEFENFKTYMIQTLPYKGE